MRLKVLLFCLLQLAAGRGWCQAGTSQLPIPTTVPNQLGVVAPASSYSTADTLAALRHLFAEKRLQRNTMVIGTVLLGGTAFVAGTKASSFEEGIALASVGVATVPVAILEFLLCNYRYSRRREQQALAASEAHRLPRRLAKKLKSYYFLPRT